MEHLKVFPYGSAVISGTLKSRPSDFQVTEELGFEPSGEGEHLFLQVEKSGLGTQELIAQISRDYTLSPRHIGYSGLKDKHALTCQWLSLHLPGQPSPDNSSSGDGYRVLRQARHHKKLRPGTHKSNSFELQLRDVESLPEQTREQMELVVNRGFANYFGVQRFGRKQDNVDQALTQLGSRRLQRSRKSLLLSSLRSFLFNQVLARRIERGHWEYPLEGDVFMLRGSHSIFSAQLDDDIVARYQQLDIASSASLYGAGRSMLSGEPRDIEAQVFAAGNDITACLDQQGAKLQMRALRATVEDFNYDYDAADRSLRLKLTLPTGCYVTTMLEHFIVSRDQSTR